MTILDVKMLVLDVFMTVTLSLAVFLPVVEMPCTLILGSPEGLVHLRQKKKTSAP